MKVTGGRAIGPLAALAPLLAAAALLLACGSSSPTGASHTSRAPAATGSPGGAGDGASRFGALRRCLKAQGITLPQRVPGEGREGSPPGAAVPLGGGFHAPRPPKGIGRSRFEAALRRCRALLRVARPGEHGPQPGAPTGGGP